MNFFKGNGLHYYNVAPKKKEIDEVITYSEGLEYTYNDLIGYEVSPGTCTDKVIRIPPTYKGSMGELPVNGIKYDDTMESLFANTDIEEFYVSDETTFFIVGSNPFLNCLKLKKLVLRGVEGVDSFAFYSNTALKYVECDEKMTYIGGGAFDGCSETATYNFSKCTSIPEAGDDNIFGTLIAGAKIIVPANLLDTWKTAENWSRYADFIVAA